MAWVWRWFYQPVPIGLINGLLSTMGIAQQPFLRSTTQALPAVLAPAVWAGLGFQIIIFLAGLQSVPAMLHEAPPPALGRVDPLLSRALFGETTGRMQADGYPERVIRWVDRIPAGMTVYCGHDQRSTDGRPYRRTGLGGGEAVFLDTGAGKGGHLSWIDLDAAPAG